jgi:hypothetical protein
VSESFVADVAAQVRSLDDLQRQHAYRVAPPEFAAAMEKLAPHLRAERGALPSFSETIPAALKAERALQAAPEAVRERINTLQAAREGVSFLFGAAIAGLSAAELQ